MWKCEIFSVSLAYQIRQWTPTQQGRDLLHAFRIRIQEYSGCSLIIVFLLPIGIIDFELNISKMLRQLYSSTHKLHERRLQRKIIVIYPPTAFLSELLQLHNI
jgi:hypothetical protein